MTWRFIFAFLALTSSVAKPQDAPQTVAKALPIYQVIEPHNGPARLLTQDGREAELQYQYSNSGTLQIPLGFVESTCQDSYYKPKCQLNLQVSTYAIDFVWVKHPDTQKLGQLVSAAEIDNNSGTKLFAVDLASSFPIYKSTASLYPQFPVSGNDQLVCDDYTWLSGIGTKAPDSFKAITMYFQGMMLNQETFLNENRVTGAINNLTFQLKDNKYDITQSGQFQSTSMSSGVPSIGITNIINLVVPKGQSSCQANFAFSLGTAVGVINPAPADVTPKPFPNSWSLIYQQSELRKNSILRLLKPTPGQTTHVELQ